MVKAWDNTPVFNDYEAFLKLKLEKDEIKKSFSASNIIAVLNLSADSTGETHAFPIFHSDTIQDLCNRYSDLFPMELKATIKEVESMRLDLYNPNGMSKERTNMAKLRLPLTIWTVISTRDPEYWKDLDAKKVRILSSYLGKLKVGQRN